MRQDEIRVGGSTTEGWLKGIEHIQDRLPREMNGDRREGKEGGGGEICIPGWPLAHQQPSELQVVAPAKVSMGPVGPIMPLIICWLSWLTGTRAKSI